MEPVELFAHVAAFESSRQRLVSQLAHSEVKLRFEEATRRYTELLTASDELAQEALKLRGDESSLEMEASTLRHKLLSLQEAASSVGGVEYRSAEAMVHEISIVEERVSGLEAQALERLVTLESTEQRLDALNQELDEASSELKGREEEWRNSEAKLVEEISRVEVQLGSAVEELAPASAQFYRRLSAKTSGVVFSVLSEGHCECCNSTLSVFEVDKVRAANGESDLSRRIRCAECGRILLVVPT